MLRGLLEPSPVFLLGVIIQYLLIQCLQCKNQLYLCLLSQARECRELTGHLWHMENEAWNTLAERQTDPSWRCLGIKREPCCHRLGMASAGESIGGSLPPSLILLLSILSFFFLYNEFWLLVISKSVLKTLYSEGQYSIRGEQSL